MVLHSDTHTQSAGKNTIKNNCIWHAKYILGTRMREKQRIDSEFYNLTPENDQD